MKKKFSFKIANIKSYTKTHFSRGLDHEFTKNVCLRSDLDRDPIF